MDKEYIIKYRNTFNENKVTEYNFGTEEEQLQFIEKIKKTVIENLKKENYSAKPYIKDITQFSSGELRLLMNTIWYEYFTFNDKKQLINCNNILYFKVKANID